MTEHQMWCQQKAFQHEDAARRIADTYNLHRIGAGHDAIGKYFAARLVDGSTDNVLYDTRAECIRRQRHNESFYTYIRIGPQSMDACEAAVMLKVARDAYDHGFRLADPDDARANRFETIKRLTVEDQMSFARHGRVTNLYVPNGKG